MEQFDIIIIGSGPGGYVAAIRASQLGFKTAVVERSEIGGICLNWGCIPTKALLKSAQALHYAQSGEEYGFSAESVTADLDKIVTRSRNVSMTMNKGIEYLFKKNKITLLSGSGKILSGKRVSVTDGDDNQTIYQAQHIIVATGSRSASLPFAPVDGEKIICYRQALVPDKLPKSMAVIGSGAIGSEFAFFYHSLGVDVTVIEFMDRILPVEDDEVSAQISRSFRKAGIKVMVSSQVKSVDTSSDMCKLVVATKKGEETLEAEIVLSAVGVVPNTEYIGLEELGVQMNRGKLTVDKYYKTNVDGIYAIGDILPTPALAHVASAEAICCVEAIAGLDPKPVNYSNIPGCTYISPEVASTGMTERAAKEKGIEYKVGKFPFTASGKATAAGERDGFVKLVVDANTDELLGAHLVGANVSEMIGGIVVARNLGVTATDIMKSIFPHPTMSEAVMEAAAAVHSESIHI
ncbi:MAG: dihydrolipoyl dehydrogenase [Bacteroidales bacterium]|nr:dihydrolipoyl dehydrogenase [Bacteroidales bacterium]MDD4670392.1 dihydrolipoyl dehydrogenase [Bacteroidales bacterium]